MTATLARRPHMNRRPDGPLTPAERNTLLEAWLAQWPYPLAFLLRTRPRLVRQGQHVGFDSEELNAACLAAAVNAARLFDPARGVKFSSFVCWHLLSGVEQLIRRAVGDQERRGEARVVSLSTPVAVGRGDTYELADLVPGRADGGDGWADAGELAAAVWAAVCRVAVDPADRVVAERRWGLDGREPQGLREIAAALGVTKERVRQREVRLKQLLRAELEHLYRDTFGGDDQ